MTITIRPATSFDVMAFYGKCFNSSMRAIAAEEDGDIHGIAGVLHEVPLQAFSSMDDEMVRHPMAIRSAIKAFRELLHTYRADVFAKASEEYKNSHRVLELVGFTRVDNDDQRLYRWAPKA